MEKIFNEIYDNNTWKINKNVKSKSGPGSDDSQTKQIVQTIPFILKKYNIKSIFDVPCGDFNWMKNIITDKYEYTGADIVNSLIDTNKKLYPLFNFITFDISKNIVEKEYDLVICRDLLVHFSYNDIQKTLTNLKKSNCKYILMTTFPKKINKNLPTPSWRPLNFQKYPFNFPEPLYIINENCTEANKKFTDKSLALWEIKTLNDNFI